jgi:hypothetical protein
VADPPKDKDDAEELRALYMWVQDAISSREHVDLDDLRVRLEQAHSLYTCGGTESRQGMIVALRGVTAYLEGELDLLPEESTRLLLALRRLLLCLEYLDLGVVQPPLKVRYRRRGGSKLTLDQAEFSLLVCVAVEILVRSGVHESEAREEIAKKLDRARFRRHRARGNFFNIDEGIIAGWQKQRGEYWDLISVNRKISYERWLRDRISIALFSNATPGGGSTLTPRSLAYRLIKALHIEFGHLRAQQSKK